MGVEAKTGRSLTFMVKISSVALIKLKLGQPKHMRIEFIQKLWHLLLSLYVFG